jgi:ribosomal protein S18 acetylase RimI-like enzyme
MEIEFRLAKANDVPCILDMMEQFNAIDHYPFNKDKTRTNLLAFLASEQLGKAWLIEANQLVIGYIVLAFGFSFEHGGRNAFVDELYMDAAYRGKGIGKRCIDFLLSETPKLGGQVFYLEVEPHNQAGVKLYREKGFRENGRILLTKKL